MLVASPPMAGFSNSGRLATCIGVTRPNRVNLRYGSHLRLRRLRRSDYSDLTHTTLRRLHVERAIHMASSFHLAGLATAWRTRGTETRRTAGSDRSSSSRECSPRRDRRISIAVEILCSKRRPPVDRICGMDSCSSFLGKTRPGASATPASPSPKPVPLGGSNCLECQAGDEDSFQ